jgi:hypothetical protein
MFVPLVDIPLKFLKKLQENPKPFVLLVKKAPCKDSPKGKKFL